jgi:integrase
MERVLTKLLTKSVPFTFNRAGYYYFSRRVPADLIEHYSYARIVQGLKTRSAHTAKVRALVAAAKLDEYWSHLRMTDANLVGKNLLKSGFKSYSRFTQPDASATSKANITLSEALETYLAQKGSNKGKTFHAAAQRACAYLVEASGAKDLADYSRTDALKYRDYLIAKGMAGSSVSRVISSIRAVMNFVISEYALDLKNPFVGIYHDRLVGVSKRPPIPIEDICKVQQQCLLLDDDLRWLVALVSDTGMRLAEVAGLLKSDVIIDEDIPFIRLQPHSWRKLKTSGSKRNVPLVGVSLWAAQRLLEACPDSIYAFPRYNKTATTNANSASAALNKWLHHYVPSGCTMHSFRHSMRDRLRAVECPADIVDQIGGWATGGVGQGYGSGYGLEVCDKWMNLILTEELNKSLYQ